MTMGFLRAIKSKLRRWMDQCRRGEAVPREPQLWMVCPFTGAQPEGCATLTPPYRLRSFTPGEEEKWVDLINTSQEFGQWSRETLQREVLATLIAGSGVFACCGDRLVGCAAGCSRKEFAPNAVLMYVAVLQEHRGRALGAAMIQEVMDVSRRAGYPGIMLATDPHRLAAIRTYLKLGFVPDWRSHPTARAQWDKVMAQIGR